MTFVLNETLEKDSVFVADLPLSQVRLLKNAAWPWVMLIPRRNNMRDVIDLTIDEQHQLTDEIAQVSFVMRSLCNSHKLNVANLGNVVSQLHVHVVARFEGDPAWPAPIWGSGFSEEYDAQKMQNIVSALQKALEE